MPKPATSGKKTSPAAKAKTETPAKPASKSTVARPKTASAGMPKPSTSGKKLVKPKADKPKTAKPKPEAKEDPPKKTKQKDKLPVPEQVPEDRPPKEEPSKENQPSKMASIWDEASKSRPPEPEPEKLPVPEPVPEPGPESEPASSETGADFWSSARSNPGPVAEEEPTGKEAFSTSSPPPPADSSLDVFTLSKPDRSGSEDDVFTSFKVFRTPVVASTPVEAEVEASSEKAPADDFPFVKKRADSANPAPIGGPDNKAAEHFEAGLAYLQKKFYDEAMAEWEEAIRLEPENRIYQSNLKRLKEKLSKL